MRSQRRLGDAHDVADVPVEIEAAEDVLACRVAQALEFRGVREHARDGRRESSRIDERRRD